MENSCTFILNTLEIVTVVNKNQLIWYPRKFLRIPFPRQFLRGKIKRSLAWEFVNLFSMLSIIRRRLEQNRITEIPPKAFSPYRKLRRMWVTFAINPIYVFLHVVFRTRFHFVWRCFNLCHFFHRSSTATSATIKLKRWRPTRSMAWNRWSHCTYNV